MPLAVWISLLTVILTMIPPTAPDPRVPKFLETIGRDKVETYIQEVCK